MQPDISNTNPKPEAASLAFANATRVLDSVHLSLSAQASFGAVEDSKQGLAQAATLASDHTAPNARPLEVEAPVNNGILHLTGLALSSMTNGFISPVVGTVQISEQGANAVTSRIPGVNQAYFHPEDLSPSEEPSYRKYSPEWFVKNIAENVGKIPWYYLAAKGLSKFSALREEAGILSQRRNLGMNIKTAAGSGFILGGLNPTDVQRDGGLLGSMQERMLQASLGAGQMALLTVGTEVTGKGLASAKKIFATTADGVSAEQLLSSTAALAQRTTLEKAASLTLKFAENGSVASVGAIPAGLSVGYLNAKAHGAKFDPAENIVATASIGFGLGGFSGGRASEKVATPLRAGTPLLEVARAKVSGLTARVSGIVFGGNPSESGFAFNGYDEVPSSSSSSSKPSAAAVHEKGVSAGAGVQSKQLAGTELAPIRSTEVIETLGSRLTRTVLEDETIIEDHSPFGPKFTTRPDGTIIEESKSGRRTSYPDGSEENVTSYRTEFRSAEGKWTITPNRWAKAWENWDSIGFDEKKAALENLDKIPPAGNLVANLVEEAFGDKYPELHKLAVEGIKKIADPAEQLNQWSLANDYHPELANDLFATIGDLSAKTQESILTGRGMPVSDLIDRMAQENHASGAAQPFDKAVDDYVAGIKDIPMAARKEIWDQLQFDSDGHARTPTLQPLANRIIAGLNSGEPDYAAAFSRFVPLIAQNFNPVDQIAPLKVERPDLRARVIGGVHDQFHEITSTLENAPSSMVDRDLAQQAQDRALGILAENRRTDLHQKVYDWGSTHDDPEIRQLIKWRFSPAKRSVELTNEFIRLAKIDVAPKEFDFEWGQVLESPFELANRADQSFVTHEQIIATKQNAVQLLQIADANRSSTGNITRAGRQFRMAALQSMAQAADPFLLTQASHPTCGMAQVEFSTYMKHPDEATRLINEVMRTGKFVTHDGSTIVIDAQSLRPENGALDMNKTQAHLQQESGSYRSYASQIFQTVAANIFWQRQTVTPDGRSVPAGTLRYEIHFQDVTDEHDNYLYTRPVDLIVDHSTPHPTMVDEGPRLFYLNQLEDIGYQIGGERTKPSVATVAPATDAEFEQYLASLPYPESFPLLTFIDLKAMANSSLPYSGHTDHVISILGPSISNRVYFKNTWWPGNAVFDQLPLGRFRDISSIE